MILIDTNSLYHSISRAYPGKKLDYAKYIEYLMNKYSIKDVVLFVDDNAVGFLKYIFNLNHTIVSKKPYRKKINESTKIWYLSFAVDIALCCPDKGTIVLCTSDYECLPICMLYRERIALCGVGVPNDLREVANTYENIPEEFLI